MRCAEARPSESMLMPLWSSFPNRGSIVEQAFIGAADLILLVNVQHHDLIFSNHVFIIYLCGSYLDKASRCRLSLLHQEQCAFDQAHAGIAFYALRTDRADCTGITFVTFGTLWSQFSLRTSSATRAG